MASAKLSTEDIAYMEAHASDSRATDIIVCCAFCAISSLLFVIARIYSRRLGATKLLTCDWMVITAWFCYIALLGTFVGIIPYGGARHIIFLTDARTYTLLMLCNELLYSVIMCLIKLSLLSLYGSIFPQMRTHWASWTTAFLVITWAIWGMLCCVLECIPLQALWDPSIEGARCIEHFGIQVAVSGAENIVLDFIILTLPVLRVLRLHMSKQQKRMLIFTFAMGGSASVVSIIREVYAGRFSSNADSTWSDVPTELVSVSELMVGFLAASIPTYRPLWRHILSQGNENDGSKGSGPSARNLAPNMGGQWPSIEKTQIKVSADNLMSRTMTTNELGETYMSEDVELSTQTMLGWRPDDAWMSVRHYGSDDSLREMV